MDTNSLRHILEHPNDNGLIDFVLGTIFILCIYHFLLYFQHKDKVYLYYSLYTFLLFVAHLKNAHYGFIPSIISPISDFLNAAWFSLIWGNSLVYFIFVFTFVNLKSYSTKWYNSLYGAVFFLLVLVIILNIFGVVSKDMISLNNVYIYFVIATSILAIVGYIPVFKMKNRIKYYIVIGSFFLFTSSLAATFLIELVKSDIGHSVFYFGVIVENIFFSLGLGAKQKLILEDKNKSQNKLIKQLKENQNLKNKVHEQLEQNLAILSRKAEEDKIEKIKADYEKELIELKMTSLRSQMNPHFIFNSLNAIKLYIIDNEKENAVYYLNKFSKLIRKILATTREKEITLADEIETLKLYMDIENIRFSNEIESSITIDDNLSINTIKIPSLILQPFIENAIWHGLSSKKGMKKIDITFEKEADAYLKITISDNGIGRTKSGEINKQKIHKKDSIGIKLTEERLNNFCKDYTGNYKLNFVDLLDNNKNAEGTKIILQIPLS